MRSNRLVLKRRRPALGAAVALAGLVLIPSRLLAQAQILPEHEPLADFDARTGRVEPTAEQLAIVTALGGNASWNRFGTPRSLFNFDGYLGAGFPGDAVAVARGWIAANRSLFRLSDAGVSGLELVADMAMPFSGGHAVLFRQRFGSLPATRDGLITVGVLGGSVAYVSSSIAGDQAAPVAASLSPVAAWLAAAASAGRASSITNVTGIAEADGWTVLSVSGFSQPQRTRLVALPTPEGGVRPAYETLYLDIENFKGYRMFVDGQTGAVLVRENLALNLTSTTPFTGTYTSPSCGPLHGPFNAPVGTKSIDVLVDAVPPNDIVLKLIHNGSVVGVSDIPVGDNPELLHYEPAGGVDPGDYFVQICPFDPNRAGPLTYAGDITINDVSGTPIVLPKWKVFESNPLTDEIGPDIRRLWCWASDINGNPLPGCDMTVRNVAARGPWDFDFRLNAPTFTTKGNAALSQESWTNHTQFSAGELYSPVAPDRSYSFAWTDQWRAEKCSPTTFASPQRNDIDASIANLFAMHNRVHDWSYFLGFTETTFNMQASNFGNNDARENDPQIGNAQAGAVTGQGRNNAFEFTLLDGVPPISAMFLWQPVAAGAYPPCVDGDYDMSVIGHEYTHAISNRMVGGPDNGIGGSQGGAMGESWSDLAAVEYLAEYGFAAAPDADPFAVGPYVTGNKTRGIRNYSMAGSPLNFGNIGYDLVGVQVHADGEIWSATNFDIRRALIEKYDAQFPAEDAALQRACADGRRNPADCPGNRRWIQLMFDAWLLVPSDVGMLDARDAYLAVDLMRFGGANRAELWRAFAGRGLGEKALSNGASDGQPAPSFESPFATEASVSFSLKDENGSPIEGKVFVGEYEARTTEAADTISGTVLGNSVKLVPGTYSFVAQANGYGAQRFTRTVKANQSLKANLVMPTNHASRSKGATATASSTMTAESKDGAENVIDDTEGTNWTGTGQLLADQAITIDLAGTAPVLIAQVNVSTLLRPAIAPEANPQNRFTALRKFRLEASTDGIIFTPVFTSTDDAFPGGEFRPAAPEMTLRAFVLPSPVSATHLRLVAETSQCQGGPLYQDDQDLDPQRNSDCTTGNAAQATLIRVAEVQAFSHVTKW